MHVACRGMVLCAALGLNSRSVYCPQESRTGLKAKTVHLSDRKTSLKADFTGKLFLSLKTFLGLFENF